MSKFTIDQNIIIKSQVPPIGIVSSNPERVLRLKDKLLQEPKQLVSSWGATVFIGKNHFNQEMFWAIAPMGASGSGLAFHELMVAGAKKIVRFGSNDVWITKENTDSIVIVKETRGLRGLSWDYGLEENQIDIPIPASKALVETFTHIAIKKQIPYDHRTCFNVDDYHAYLYPENSMDSERIKARLAYYDTFAPYCRDMESAALFLKAKQFNVEVASVLQNVIKQKKQAPYEGQSGEQAKNFEITIANIIIEGLMA